MAEVNLTSLKERESQHKHNSESSVVQVKVLVEGHTTADSKQYGEETTCPTITLVRGKNITLVVDPGCLKSQSILVDKLKGESLTVDDVDIVCITHSHIDHYRNIGMFPEAKTLEYWGLWDGMKCEDWKEQFTDDIRIIKTPGHNYDCISLLVKTDIGTIAIVGDVFWKENGPKDDQYASDKEKLAESRKTVLRLADYIIPGHGKMFKVKK